MSLLDTASLIVTPNGYKEGKLYSVIPSDGSGDMSVTRATTATRVNSAGLVELVPYNLVQYSEQFDNAAWTKTASTITANAITAPNGTLTADALFETTANSQHNFFGLFSPTISGNVYTISFYAKANGRNKIRMNNGSSSLTVEMNLSTGVATQLTGTSTNVITSVGDGWYRCSMTYTANADTQYVAMNTRDDSGNDIFVGDASKGIYIWGGQANEGSTALPYQKTETRLNIPRLDYSNGTCPSLLVEPQRTNLALYSSSFDSSQWQRVNSTIANNQIVSPSGIQDAVLFTTTSTSAESEIRENISSFASSSVWTTSVYAKKGTGSFLRIRNLFVQGGNSQGNAWFDLDNGTVGTIQNSQTAKIEDVGNGWYRCSLTGNYTGVAYDPYIDIAITNSNGSIFPSTNVNGYLWGAQCEAGSYQTSYIPTQGSTVTRNADVISKTGIADLIGQTEGTLYFEIDKESLQDDSRYMFVSDGSFSNRIVIYQASSGINVYCSAGAGFNFVFNPPSGNLKVAVGYKSGLYTFFVNGIERATSNISAVPTGLNTTGIGVNEITFGAAAPSVSYNTAALFKTRLTNAELATLTTI